MRDTHGDFSNLIDKKNKRLLAYIYMPIIFSLLAGLIVFVIAKPITASAINLLSLITYDEEISKNSSLSDIYTGTDYNGKTVDNSEVEIPYINTRYATLECEKIGLSVPVYYGDTNLALKKGVGQYDGSYMPGYSHPTLIAGHAQTHFNPLKDVQNGDIMTFTTNYGVYTYEVYKTKVIGKSEYNIKELSQNKEELILYTCYPFEKMASVKNDRLFIYCKYISGPKVINIYSGGENSEA